MCHFGQLNEQGKNWKQQSRKVNVLLDCKKNRMGINTKILHHVDVPSYI